ncbi:MAG: replication-associated recombination protein A [Saprospiraceae bacterium]|nr:replication-associated recombination protein A [Saprospiraceae bacterium]
MIPLAERMRPQHLDEILGQDHLIGPDKPLRKMLEKNYIPSMILWGPPGVGKTTLARVMGQFLNRAFYTISAISSGVKEIREIIQSARETSGIGQSPILFIDEIHRFNKSQQDALLGAVEEGTLTLIGATTENPSFEVNSALLSRMQVYVLQALTDPDLNKLIQRILVEGDEYKTRVVEIQSNSALFRLAGGDARKLCNVMEILASIPDQKMTITDQLVMDLVSKNAAMYDKGGEMHYDMISAFIKSVRGSDPHAALYWMARMIDAGEDPLFIARRLIILASEDIGLANPNAFLMAQACAQALHQIGWPEGRIPLAETAIYLACSSKSNSAYLAIEKAISLAKEFPHLPVPLHLRNAPTRMMKNLDYGKGYEYAHHHPFGFITQEYMPNEIAGTKIYDPGNNPSEEKTKEILLKLWGQKYF